MDIRTVTVTATVTVRIADMVIGKVTVAFTATFTSHS